MDKLNYNRYETFWSMTTFSNLGYRMVFLLYFTVVFIFLKICINIFIESEILKSFFFFFWSGWLVWQWGLILLIKLYAGYFPLIKKLILQFLKTTAVNLFMSLTHKEVVITPHHVRYKIVTSPSGKQWPIHSTVFEMGVGHGGHGGKETNWGRAGRTSSLFNHLK